MMTCKTEFKFVKPCSGDDDFTKVLARLKRRQKRRNQAINRFARQYLGILR